MYYCYSFYHYYYYHHHHDYCYYYLGLTSYCVIVIKILTNCQYFNFQRAPSASEERSVLCGPLNVSVSLSWDSKYQYVIVLGPQVSMINFSGTPCGNLLLFQNPQVPVCYCSGTPNVSMFVF